mgnify:CR=1 FL=1
MQTPTSTAQPAKRVPSKLERTNTRQRNSAGTLALIGVLGAILFIGSTLLFVVVLTNIAHRGSVPFAAEPTVIDVIDGDTIDMTAAVSRWGNSSFDVSINGSVDGESRFDAVITYVSIDPVSQRPAPVPDFVKAALDR